MRLKLLYKIISLVLFSGLSYAQESSKSTWLIGIDISKNFPPLVDKKYYFQKSLIVEPIIKYKIEDNFMLNALVGYAKIEANPIYKNLHYHNEGIYLKAGVDLFAIKERLSFGLMGVYSYFSEYGQFVIEGPYYGNVYGQFETRSFNRIGFEANIGFWFKAGKKFVFNPTGRTNIFSNPSKNGISVYYVPGMGINYKAVPLTGGFSLALFYRL